jgi:hypothetical protein
MMRAVRLVAGSLVSALVGVAACASLSGLNDLSAGADAGSSGREAESGDAPNPLEGEDAALDDATAPEEASDPTEDASVVDADAATAPPDGSADASAAVESGGPPVCVLSKCTNTCPLLPLAEAPCCKSDHTCGCGAVLGILLCN